MSIQHVDIEDAYRHEAKGASSASAGQVCKSNGDGTTSFDYIDFNEIAGSPTFSVSYTEELRSFEVANQLATGLGVPNKVTFGPNLTEANVALEAIGDITFTSDGTYTLRADLAAGKNVAGAGGLTLFFRLVKEVAGPVQTQVGQTVHAHIPANSTRYPVVFEETITVVAGEKFYIEMAKDATDAAGLFSQSLPSGLTSDTPPWTDVFSARLLISRLGA